MRRLKMDGWTPECLEPEQIIELCKKGQTGAESAEWARHVLKCGFCFRAYKDTRSLLGSSALAPDPVRVPTQNWAWRWGYAGLGFAAGAAALWGVMWFGFVPESKEREVQLEAQVESLRQERAVQAEEQARLVQANERLQSLSKIKASPAQPDLTEAQMLEAAVLSGKLHIPARVLALAGTVRGEEGSGAWKLVGPKATLVADQRPLLKVEAREGVTPTLTLLDSYGNVAEVKAEGDFRWRPVAPLVRGKTYTWTVSASGNGKEETSEVAAFGVLDAEAWKAVQAAKTRYRDHPLTLGVVLAQAGLLDDSEAAFADAQKRNPRDETVMKLLTNLEQARTGGL